MALCRPAEHPWCWWDPTGRPAAATAGGPMAAGPPAGLWAEVQVSPPLDQLSHPPAGRADAEQWGERDELDFPGRRPPRGRRERQAAADRRAGRAVGRGRPPAVRPAGHGRGRAVRDRAQTRATRLLGRGCDRRGVLDDQFHLVAVHPDGTKAAGSTVRRELMWGEPGVARDLTEDAYADGPRPDDRLLQRPGPQAGVRHVRRLRDPAVDAAAAGPDAAGGRRGHGPHRRPSTCSGAWTRGAGSG